MNRQEANRHYAKLFSGCANKKEKREMLRFLAKSDLFFLLSRILRRPDIEHDWLYLRCREVQESPNGHLDLWARGYYKSTIITFGQTIQDILNDPNITIGFFSFTRPISKAFLRQIKREFEDNDDLKGLFPEIFYDKPKTQAPKWSENDGIVVKRSANPKESTIEAWGLVDGMPTSRHFSLRVYDDIITDTSVTTPEMIAKVTQAWELSQSLDTPDGNLRVLGTPYHYADTYSVIKKRKSLILREYPATENGKEHGEPVLLAKEILEKKRRDQGEYIFACQMLLNPVAADLQELKEEHLNFWPAQQYKHLNVYILVDPAGEKKKENDYTVFTVIGVGGDGNYYVITWVRDKLNLVGKSNTLFALHRQFRPLNVGYEKYGMQSDIEHFKDKMDRENYRFKLTPVAGATKKEDRVRKLVPLLEQSRLYLPETCVRTDYTGKAQDLTKVFINEEYKTFPFSVHDDMLDCLARVFDIKTEVPELDEESLFGLNFTLPEARNAMVKKAFIQKERDAASDYSTILTDGMRAVN